MLMTIGQLAKIIGVNVETIRFYHREDLLTLPIKPSIVLLMLVVGFLWYFVLSCFLLCAN